LARKHPEAGAQQGVVLSTAIARSSSKLGRPNGMARRELQRWSTSSRDEFDPVLNAGAKRESIPASTAMQETVAGARHGIEPFE
jgi:hypothetical protein